MVACAQIQLLNSLAVFSRGRVTVPVLTTVQTLVVAVTVTGAPEPQNPLSEVVTLTTRLLPYIPDFCSTADLPFFIDETVAFQFENSPTILIEFVPLPECD